MGDAIRSNFEPGRWLLAAGLILSVVLMLQLYAINETVDIGSLDTLLGRNTVGLLLVVSYLLTTVAMLAVVSEFFKVRKRIDGLFALTELLDKIEDLQAPHAPQPAPLPASTPLEGPPVVQAIKLEEEKPEEELDELLLESEPESKSVVVEKEAAPTTVEETAKTSTKKDQVSYRKIEVKIDDGSSQPKAAIAEEEMDLDAMDEMAQQRFFDDEVDEVVDDMLKQSEVIATLNELERVVEELKLKKGVYSPN
ncbi:MAG: hypothetical protein ABIJ47_01650 [Candidatus Bathyarchaeota archaeon]